MSIGPCTGKRWVCHLTYDQSSHQSQVLKEKNTIVDKIHQNQHIFNQLWDVIPYAVGFSHHADDKNSVKSMTFDARNGPALAVPVSYFAFPDSMQAAVAQPGLTRLTLENVTMDIDEYRRQLESSPWASSTSGPRPAFPSFAPSIHTLVMKDFLLGYPLGFLPALSRQLPNLHNLTLAQQRFTGQSMETAREAVQFVNAISDLVEMHFVDVFVPKGFVTALAAEQRMKPEGQALLILQVDYTYREMPAPSNGDGNYDPIQDALGRIPASELPKFITRDLTWLSFSMLPHTPTGILPYWYSATAPFVGALLSEDTAPKKLSVNIHHFSIFD